MFIITVTLNPALDKILSGSSLTLGHENRFKNVYYSAGGKGLNVSRALQRLRMTSLATGFLGGFTGQCIQHMIDLEKISSQFNWINGETRTSVSVVDSKGTLPTRLLEEGPKVTRRDIKNFTKSFQSLLKGCCCVAFCGRNISGANHKIYFDLINIAHKQNVQTVLDTSGPALVEGLKAKPFLIKPNLAEAESVLRRKLKTKRELKFAVRYFLKRGIKNVVISLGRAGAVGSEGEDVWLAKPPSHRTQNTVGCGDSLVGGFINSMAKGRSFQDSLKWGVATGTANALNYHPGHFSARKVYELVKKINLRRI